MARTKPVVAVVPSGPPKPEMAFEAFCREHGMSGVLIWSEEGCEPGQRPVADSHVCMLDAHGKLDSEQTAQHRGGMAYLCAQRLRDFQNWLDSLLAGRILR